jgi:hypothetical protein
MFCCLIDVHRRLGTKSGKNHFTLVPKSKIAKRQSMRRILELAQFFEANLKLAIFATAKLINGLGGQSAQQYRGRFSDAKILIGQLEQLEEKPVQALASSSSKAVW